MVFLQDLSGSMGVGGRLEASHEAIDYFLESARPGDEFALATFAGEDTNIDVPFTEDLAALRESVDSWEGYGKTALHDAVALLPRISNDSRNVKRAAVLITDGAQFDLLIGLAQEHVRQLKGHFPEQAGKVSLMRDWDPASVGLDVEDPYGEPYASYEEMGRVLIPAIRGLLGLAPSSSSDGGSRRP